MPLNIRLKEKPKDYKEPKKKKERIIQNITFFGDSAIPEEDKIYKTVFETAKLLSNHGYTIVNGGGPGLMKAATDGAESVDGVTSVVYWEPRLASFFEGKNLVNVADSTDSQSNYVNRTFGLISQGDAYIVCKGGTGTISEFGLVWALSKLYYGVHKPVILFGEFWEGIISSFQKNMYIDEIEYGVLYFAKEPEDILDILNEHESKLDTAKLKQTDSDEKAFMLQSEKQDLNEKHKKTRGAYDLMAGKVDKHKNRFKDLPSRNQLDEFISLVNPPAKVLDLGCGIGFDLQYLSEHYSVTAVEFSPKLCEIAKRENPEAEIICEDITKFNYQENTYKGVWARDSIHHVSDELLFDLFKNISNSLVENGVFYLIVREGEGETYEKDRKSLGEKEVYYNLLNGEKLSLLGSENNLKIEKLEAIQRSHKWVSCIFRKG